MTNLQFVSSADETEQRHDKGDVRWIPIAAANHLRQSKKFRGK